MRKLLHFSVVLSSMMMFAHVARSEIIVDWDCYLPTGDVSCTELERDFFSNPAFTRNAPSSQVNVETKKHARYQVRGINTSDGLQVTMQVSDAEGYTSTVVDRLPREFSVDAKQMRVLTELHKVSAHFFILEAPALTEDGSFTLKLKDPALALRSARKNNDDTLWYLAPELSVYTEQFGLQSIGAYLGGEENFSHKDWRIRAFQFLNYRYVHVDDDSGTADPDDLTYQNLDVGIDAYLVRSLGNGFAVGTNPYCVRTPRENYALRAGALVGAEWMLSPILKNDEGNIGFRYEIGVEYQNYVHTTTQNLDALYLARHRLRALGQWHFTAVDLDGSVTAQSVVNNLQFSSISANASLTWRVIDSLSVSLEGEASYRNGLLNEPRDISELHPLEQFFGGGNYGALNYWTSLGITYTFGNSLLQRQDRRWTN